MLSKQVQYVTHSEYLRHLFLSNPFPEMIGRKDISKILLLVRQGCSPEMLAPLEIWVKGEMLYSENEEDPFNLINFESLITYLSLTLCEHITAAPIAVSKNGSITVFYNQNEKNYESNKITLEINKKKIIFSILNRENELAIATGELKLSTQSLYKIEQFMKIDLASIATTSKPVTFTNLENEINMDEDNVKRSQVPKTLMNKLDIGSGLLKQKSCNVSIRLPVDLIEELKFLGKKENMGYQTLAKAILTNFVAEHRAEVLQAVLDDNKRMEKEIQDLNTKYKKLKKLKKIEHSDCLADKEYD